MKKLILTFIWVLFIPSVLADYRMMGYGMMSSFGFGLYSIVWFIIVSFVFSVVFWSTYKLIIKNKKQRK